MDRLSEIRDMGIGLRQFRDGLASSAPGTYNVSEALKRFVIDNESLLWQHIVVAARRDGKAGILRVLDAELDEMREEYRSEAGLQAGTHRECDSCGSVLALDDLSPYCYEGDDDDMMLCPMCIRAAKRDEERGRRHAAWLRSPAGQSRQAEARRRREERQAEDATRQARHNASRFYWDER